MEYLRRFFFTALLILPLSLSVQAESVLLLKGGKVDLSEDTPLDFGSATFDESSDLGLGIEYQWRFANGFSIGGELLNYEHEFRYLGFNGTADTIFLSFNGKKYFNVTQWFKPFLGAGLGVALADFSGPITGNTAGTGLQLNAGMEFQFGAVGLYGEYKYINADTEDSESTNYDASGDGFFGGLTIHF